MRLLALVLASVAFAGSAAAANWTTFKDPNGAFSVAFPASPAVATAQTDAGGGAKVPMSVYNTTFGGIQFVVIDTNLSGYNMDPVKAVENAADGTKKAAADTKADGVAHAGAESGRALTIMDRNGKRVVDRIFFVRGHLYQVMATAPANSPDTDSQRFVDSFHFAQ